MNSTRGAMLAGITACSLLLLAGCTNGTTADTQSGSGSRAVLYDTIDDLARDSTAIVVGSVTDQREDGDATVSTIEVLNTPSNPELGQNAPEARPIAVGNSVEVRQDAPSKPVLEIGTEYVLWLTPTMLTGETANQFFITGSNAGLYIRDGNTARRGATDTGDGLPDTIEISG